MPASQHVPGIHDWTSFRVNAVMAMTPEHVADIFLYPIAVEFDLVNEGLSGARIANPITKTTFEFRDHLELTMCSAMNKREYVLPHHLVSACVLMESFTLGPPASIYENIHFCGLMLVTLRDHFGLGGKPPRPRDAEDEELVPEQFRPLAKTSLVRPPKPSAAAPALRCLVPVTREAFDREVLEVSAQIIELFDQRPRDRAAASAVLDRTRALVRTQSERSGFSDVEFWPWILEDLAELQ